MRRLLNNLQKKNKYYNEIFKIISGMIYDIQNSGREEDFKMLVGKRAEMMKAVDEIDAQRRKIVATFDVRQQPHIKALLLCKEEPKTSEEKAVYNIVQENRKLLRRIITYNKNLEAQVKHMISKAKI